MNVALPVDLPNVANARLPGIYVAAKAALAKCVEIDECKDWADKAEAMASYARQSGDKDMRDMADRIQARALDKVGELIEQIPKAPYSGGPKPNLPGQILVSPREQARIAAGLSKSQAANAISIHNVPRDQFETLVESENPPTAKKLAEMGRKKRTRQLVPLGNRTPAEFAAATGLIGLLEDFVREMKVTDVYMALRGCDKHELKRLSSSVETALWHLKNLDRIRRGSKWRTSTAKAKKAIRAATSGLRSTRSSRRP